ncbi:MAG: hypothetical protein LBM28_03830 [Oscillospiraceae bacterium]|jgi:hypothetical protein|nr:hypothetical protein [Oscillospiraceae bacterium]
MKKLIEIYQEIADVKDTWCYYINANLHLHRDNLFGEHRAKTFIKEYFHAGGKIEVFKQLDLIPNAMEEIEPYRWNHILSSFLLGIAIERELKGVPFEKSSSLQDIRYDDFLYYWYLISLYHDVGYVFENNSSEYAEKYKTWSAFLSDNDICINNIRHRDCFLINNYYSYRINEHKTIDHGIVSGSLLYSGLLKVYKSAKNAPKYDKLPEKNGFTYNGLFFPDTLPCMARDVALSIMKHNIWQANGNTEDTYKQYGLNELLPNEWKPITYKKDQNGCAYDPFLFLLAIADTLEPLKRFQCYDPQVVLNNISLDFSGNPKEIIITVDKPLITEEYFKGICGLGKNITQEQNHNSNPWLNVETLVQGNQVIITLM